MKRYSPFLFRFLPALLFIGLLSTAVSHPSATLQLQAQHAGLSAEDVVAVRTVSAAVMSPDGRHVAYTVTRPPLEDADRARSTVELFIVAAGGGDPVPVITHPQSASAPQWLPDGRLAFTARLTDHSNQVQVYAVNAAAENLEKLTNAETGVMQFAVSADGSTLIYRSRDAETEEQRQRRSLGYDMMVFSDAPRAIRLFAQPLDTPESRALTPDGWLVQDFAVSPNGDEAIVRKTTNPLADYDLMFSELHRVNLNTGAHSLLTETAGKLGAIRYSPDGAQIAFLGAKVFSDPLPQRIFVLNRDGSNVRDITPDDYHGTIEWIGWKDNRNIWFTAVESTRTTLNEIAATGGRISRIAGGELEIFSGISPDARGRTFAAAVNQRTHPGEAFVGSFRNGTFTRLTHHNSWLSERSLGRQETVRWYASDGHWMEGVLVYPVGYEEGERYPLAVLPHGGPEGVDLDGWNTRALYPVHFLAANGYVVFMPNYRGSAGRGSWFTMANHRDLGGREFEDVLLGIDFLEDKGLIDPDRVGMSGTSYGGYFSAWAGTRHSYRFAAAITFAGLSNWISFTGTTDIPVEMMHTHWDLSIFDNMGQYWDRSPVAHLENARTPILVATGLADERVHPEQAIQLYNFLRLREVPTDLILYPRQPHGLLERAHQLDFMARVLDWFDTYLKD
ncbi:Dipeptidyl aminopeptidase/acylaminoacyl peptidase [Cyclonatronum proteinivorum]|uniref:Dipeptidyl aminopeptidase/acylaminoacyl peptidase n=1 Tax=Cyclonatronum proteinivorum TaxID=1457365 RepID=A0A345UJF2_9BACT|nr:S9 family peptidase [Cyclonatronum proteinivorum]AXJ00604.1 Dipeptidyl aminopeptidase/acylaminoacyl peptidase [Cyclonatronum proteinivorum]